MSDTSTSGTALRIRWTELWAVFNYSEATEVCQPARQEWTEHREDVVKMKREMYPGSHKSSMSEILRCDFSSTAWGPLDSADNKVLRLWGWQQEDFHFQGEASSFLLKVTRLKRNFLWGGRTPTKCKGNWEERVFWTSCRRVDTNKGSKSANILPDNRKHLPVS